MRQVVPIWWGIDLLQMLFIKVARDIGLTLGHKSGGAWRPSQAAMCGGKAPCSVS